MLDNRKVFIIAGLAAFIYFFIKIFGKKNQLNDHFEEQRQLNEIGNVATAAGADSLDDYPLTTFGDLPLSGVHYDPFTDANPAAQPKQLVTLQSIISF